MGGKLIGVNQIIRRLFLTVVLALLMTTIWSWTTTKAYYYTDVKIPEPDVFIYGPATFVEDTKEALRRLSDSSVGAQMIALHYGQGYAIHYTNTLPSGNYWDGIRVNVEHWDENLYQLLGHELAHTVQRVQCDGAFPPEPWGHREIFEWEMLMADQLGDDEWAVQAYEAWVSWGTPRHWGLPHKVWNPLTCELEDKKAS